MYTIGTRWRYKCVLQTLGGGTNVYYRDYWWRHICVLQGLGGGTHVYYRGAYMCTIHYLRQGEAQMYTVGKGWLHKCVILTYFQTKKRKNKNRNMTCFYPDILLFLPELPPIKLPTSNIHKYKKKTPEVVLEYVMRKKPIYSDENVHHKKFPWWYGSQEHKAQELCVCISILSSCPHLPSLLPPP